MQFDSTLKIKFEENKADNQLKVDLRNGSNMNIKHAAYGSRNEGHEQIKYKQFKDEDHC